MTQAELNRELTQPEQEQLVNYRARIAEYRRVHEQLDDVVSRHQDNLQQAIAQNPHWQSVTPQLSEMPRLLDKLQGSTPEERAQVAAWEKQLGTLALNELEERDLKKWEARVTRAQQVPSRRPGEERKEGELAKRWRAGSLAVVDPLVAADPVFQFLQQGGKDWYQKYNLPNRIAQYELDKKQQILFASDLPAYADEARALVRQHKKELKSLAAQRWPDDIEVAATCVAVMSEILNAFEWHVAKDLAKPKDRPKATGWGALLCKPDVFGIAELYEAFKKVGLLDTTDQPTPVGLSAKGAWAGAIDELTAPPALLTANARAVCRCLKQWGIILAENTLRNNTSAEADNTRKAMKVALGRK